jgi:cytochrome c biogenesis protein CcmG/thiol:disulfide interchange protein DsbE
VSVLRQRMSDRVYGRVPRWFLIAAPLVLAGLVVSMTVRLPADVVTASFLRPSPSTSGTDLLGRRVSLGSLRGAPLVVIFFASWCGPCHEDAPIFTGLAGRYGQRVGLLSVAIDDAPHDVRAFAMQYGWTWPIVRDHEHRWVAAFDPPGVPATFVIDADGAVIRTLTGPVTEDQIDAALDPLVSTLAR